MNASQNRECPHAKDRVKLTEFNLLFVKPLAEWEIAGMVASIEFFPVHEQSLGIAGQLHCKGFAAPPS